MCDSARHAGDAAACRELVQVQMHERRPRRLHGAAQRRLDRSGRRNARRPEIDDEVRAGVAQTVALDSDRPERRSRPADPPGPPPPLGRLAPSPRYSPQSGQESAWSSLSPIKPAMNPMVELCGVRVRDLDCKGETMLRRGPARCSGGSLAAPIAEDVITVADPAWRGYLDFA